MTHYYIDMFLDVYWQLSSLAIFDQKSNMQGRIDINPFFLFIRFADLLDVMTVRCHLYLR